MSKLILGPSCSGKSYLIDLLINKKEIDVENVIYGFELLEHKSIKNNSVVHFNMLNFLIKRLKNFFDDPVTKQLINSLERFEEVIFIVSSLSELHERALKRDIVEKNIDEKYNNNFWLDVFQKINIFYIYEEIFEYFDLLNIPYKVLWSSKKFKKGFEPIDRVFVHHVLRGREKFIFPKPSDVSQFLDHESYEYQDTILPYSMSTIKRKAGHIQKNREVFFDPIKMIDLRGCSVLDVGCALGQYLYRAERYGAKKICGIDKMSFRFNAAQKINKLLLSNAELKNEFFTENSVKEKFDLVLCLNVIHHIKDVDSFISNLWNVTSKKLVLEFPTFFDPKFMKISKLCSDDASNLNNFPIIGVSSLKLVDQTYVYSPSSIVGILADRSEDEPKNIQQFKSSFEGRTFLVFSK